MSVVTLGYIGLAIFAAIVLTPFAIRIVQFFRTTSLADLAPRVRVVSQKRAGFDPAHWENVSPWCCRKKC